MSHPSPANQPQPAPEPAEFLASFHDAPTAAELLEVVDEYLRTEVVATAVGKARFNARVAANVVALVARQLQQPATVAHELTTALETLGYRDDAQLAAAIRAGELDDDFEPLQAYLRQLVAAKLAVSNPKYRGEHA